MIFSVQIFLKLEIGYWILYLILLFQLFYILFLYWVSHMCLIQALLGPMTILIIVLWTVVPFLLQVIQLMISNTFLVRLMQQLFLSKHLIIKFYILCVISVKCTVWILKLLLNPMIILILFLMVGRYTFLKFEKNNINSIFKDV